MFPHLAASIGYALNATIFILSSSAKKQVVMEQQRMYMHALQ